MVVVEGENGAGKTNLLEAIHVGTQGFSPRARNDAQLIRFGEQAAALTLEVERDRTRHELKVSLVTGEGRSATLDGGRLASAELLRRDFPALVFTPDRLAVVKGGPAARRAYFDRVASRLFPARAGIPQDYAAALAQRNAGLRRVQLGLSDRGSLEPWTARVSALGAELIALRVATLEALAAGFAAAAGELGLPEGTLAYEGEAAALAAYDARLAQDVSRGSTGLGPHLHDVRISSASRELRPYGSQGEQRLALLALLLAEVELLPGGPLLLLDDVLSELDGRRREVLAARLTGVEQTVITTTHRSLLPAEPAQVVSVTPGRAV